MNFFRILLQTVIQVVSLLVIVDAVLSFFMSPYSQVRQVVGRIVNPLLQPIRKIIPPLYNIDFSPVILLLLLQLLSTLINRVL
jgi:YggT family protein